MAGTTGLEPATSDVTGRRSNQLNYVPAMSRDIPMLACGVECTQNRPALACGREYNEPIMVACARKDVG
jgi:hypothetical protein